MCASPVSISHGEPIPRGKWDQRRAVLRILDIMRGWVPIEVPDRLRQDIVEAGDLRPVMGRLDAVICVSCVYAHWLYAGRGTQLLGGREGGCMLLPGFEVRGNG